MLCVLSSLSLSIGKTDINGRRLAKDRRRDVRVPGMRISEARYIIIDIGLYARVADFRQDVPNAAY